MTTMDEALAGLSKPELVRLVKRLAHTNFFRLNRIDIMSVQHAEASDQSMAAMNAAIAMQDKVHQAQQAETAAFQALRDAALSRNNAATRRAEKAWIAAQANHDQVRAEKDKLWATHERHQRRADKLWYAMERERA